MVQATQVLVLLQRWQQPAASVATAAGPTAETFVKLAPLMKPSGAQEETGAWGCGWIGIAATLAAASINASGDVLNRPGYFDQIEHCQCCATIVSANLSLINATISICPINLLI